MIRPATHADTDAIAQLWEQLVNHHLALDNALPRPAPDGAQNYAHRLSERLDQPQTGIFVAEEDGLIVGFVLAAIVDLVPEVFIQETGGFLADIYVDPAYRGRGIGRALVETVRDWFRLNGLDSFEWYVAARNPEGRAFWRAMGGREVMIRMRADI